MLLNWQDFAGCGAGLPHRRHALAARNATAGEWPHRKVPQ
jgi:hypothetical protein